MRPNFSLSGNRTSPSHLWYEQDTDANSISSEVAELRSQVERDIWHALEPSSLKIYKTRWSQFTSFLLVSLGKNKFAATQADVSIYVAFLHNLGIQSETIRGHLSAIAFFYKGKGLINPTESFHISKLLTAYSKSDRPKKTRKPITQHILEKIISSLVSLVFGL